MLLDTCQYRRPFCFIGWRQVLGERPPGMEHIPRRPLLSAPAASRVMNPKTIYYDVPQWLVSTYEQPFCQGNPQVVNQQPATKEVGRAEVPGLIQGTLVIHQALVKYFVSVRFVSLTPAFRQRPAHINGYRSGVVWINYANGLVWLKVSCVIKTIYPGPSKCRDIR